MKPERAKRSCKPGDSFVLCTDGVHGRLDNAALDRGARRRDLGPSTRAAQLVDEALTRGTTDNATALVLHGFVECVHGRASCLLTGGRSPCAACGRNHRPTAAPTPTSASLPASRRGSLGARQAGRRHRSRASCFLGDSLTAGLGLAREQSYPALIGKQARGARATTTRSSTPACPATPRPAACGGSTGRSKATCACWSSRSARNDGLRGLPPQRAEEEPAGRARSRERRETFTVILAGMEAPPNNGPDYTREFRDVYAELAKEYRRAVHAVPAAGRGRGRGAQPGRRHSSERSRRAVVADLVWEELEPALPRPNAEAQARSAPSPKPNDPAARRQQDRPERRPAAHHPASARSRRARRAVPGDHRAVGQRQVDAARADRGSRLARRPGRSRSTASTSRRSTKTRWRGCAARRSASSSSSSTSCRR